MLYSFAGPPTDASNPWGVVAGSGGVLYGATDGGDASCSGCGAVFSLTPPSYPGGRWTEAILHYFAGPPNDGSTISANVIVGSGGEIYGTTEYGGTLGGGTAYELMPPSSPAGQWTEIVLHSFAGYPYDGVAPHASLAIGGGVLYGTTLTAGLWNSGSAFSLTPPASAGEPWTEEVLYNFSGGSFPSYPQAGLAIGSTGVLYGTTGNGGVLQYGTVFALRPPSSPGGSWTETTLHNFRGTDGNSPIAPVTLTQNGMLYGTTYEGGTSNFGTVFSLNP